MNILNIFNNLVTLSTPHNPTHTLPKQPQCSYKYNVYQYVVPTLQGNPPMSTASEESSAGFLPEAPQIKRETGQQEPEIGNRAAGIKCRRADSRTGRTGTGRKHRQPENGIEKAGQEHRKAGHGHQKPENPKTGRESPMPKRPVFRKRSEADRAGTKKRKPGIGTARPSSTVSSPT